MYNNNIMYLLITCTEFLVEMSASLPKVACKLFAENLSLFPCTCMYIQCHVHVYYAICYANTWIQHPLLSMTMEI